MDTTALVPTDLGVLLTRFGIAIALGFLIGSERERSTPDHSAPGVRTFTILTLAGALAVVFGPIVLAAATLAAVAVALSPTLNRHRKNDPPGYGATTVSAAAAAPVLGALAVVMPTAAAAAAVAIAVTLAAKARLHLFIRNTVTPTELTDALKFFIIALVIVPLLPDETLDPFNVINPRKIGLLVTALIGIGWVGYLAVRTLGAKRGLPLAGLAGGFVSSTATTAAMARRGRVDILRRPAVSAAVLSKVSSLAVLVVLAAAIDVRVVGLLAAPLTAMVLVLAAASWLLIRGQTLAQEQASIEEEERSNPEPEQQAEQSRARHRKHKHSPERNDPDSPPVSPFDLAGGTRDTGEPGSPDDGDSEPLGPGDEQVLAGNDLDIGRPFALKPALILAFVITLVLFLSKAAATWIGPGAVIAVAAVTGAADTQASAVAAAALAKTGALTPVLAMIAIVAALITNTLVKIVLGYTAGGRRTGHLLAAVLAPAAAVLAVTTTVTAVVAWPA
jgi:uncharacterized membrane protein (DUF4010 family)